MEVRFDPQLQSLPRIQKKKERGGEGKAFEEALDGSAAQGEAREDRNAGVSQRAQVHKKASMPRNDDGKGLKVDLLA